MSTVSALNDEPPRAQARDGDEARAVGDLDQQVLAFLGSHGCVLSI